MNTAHDNNEIRRHLNAIEEIEKAPLADRQAARAEWHAACQDPTLVAQRLGWLLDGNYGYGSYLAARSMASLVGRTNRAAGLSHMIAALEWRCSAAFAREVYVKRLTDVERTALDAAVAQVLADYDAEVAGGV
jgi:hypothetical protein